MSSKTPDVDPTEPIEDALEEGDADAALALADAALAADPENGDVAYLRAHALLDLERDEEAVEVLEQLAEGDPPHALSLAALSGFELDADEDDEALESAADLARRAVAAAREHDEDALPPAWNARLEAFARYPEGDDARTLVREVTRDLGESDALTHRARGLVAFRAADFATAVAAFTAAVAADREDPASVHDLGCALERVGELDAANAAFARAAELDPEGFVVPHRVSPEEFGLLAREAFARLPEELGEGVEESCLLVIEDFPAPSEVTAGHDPLALGMFRGTPVGEAAPGTPTPEVVLFQKNLERVCGSREELEDEVETTLLHEVGHALGLDEEGVDEFGLR